MKIRKMAEADIPKLAKLNVQIFGDTDETQAVLVFSNSFHNGIPGACLVCEDADGIAGGIIAEKKITFYPNTASIKSFFVIEEHQGKGIGKELLEKCLAALKDAGIESVSLTVDPENTQAISIYEKSGFGLFRLKYLKRF